MLFGMSSKHPALVTLFSKTDLPTQSASVLVSKMQAVGTLATAGVWSPVIGHRSPVGPCTACAVRPLPACPSKCATVAVRNGGKLLVRTELLPISLPLLPSLPPADDGASLMPPTGLRFSLARFASALTRVTPLNASQPHPREHENTRTNEANENNRMSKTN